MLKWYFVIFWLGWTATANADPEIGKTLFAEKKCALCHRIENPGTVFKPICPGLKGVNKRHDREWLARWLKNPAEVWAEQGPDVQDINRRFFEFRGSKPRKRDSFMATIIGKQIVLTDEEIQHLIDYIRTL